MSFSNETLRKPLFCMVVDGIAVTPFALARDRAVFLLPPGTQEARLISRTWSPNQVNPSNPDNRQLGLRIDSLAVGSLIGSLAVVDLGSANLMDGFHDLEREGEAWFVWTDGDARLPRHLWANLPGAVVLCLSGSFDHFALASHGDQQGFPENSGEKYSFSQHKSNSSLFRQPNFIPSQTTRFFLAVKDGLLPPIALTHSEAVFIVPAGTCEVALLSPAWSPTKLDPASSDDRHLGLLIEGLSIDFLVEPAITIALDDRRLLDGFHSIEHGTEGVYRWTTGNGRLADARWGLYDSAFLLRVRGQFDNAATNPGERELVLRFENLGSDCEFGIVQRLSTAEPLGLLRWADVPFPSLMEALEDRFAGLGEPEFTQVSCGEGREYFTYDTRWGLPMHTFIKEPDATPDEILSRMCRHIVFLREKMISDLETASKIFIYKHDDLSMWELRALHDSLCQFGPIRLLHVKRLKDNKFPFLETGRINGIRDGLCVGFLESLATDSVADRLKDWKKICRLSQQYFAEEAMPIRPKLELVATSKKIGQASLVKN